jgi:uncharacterized protein (TIGR03067 family)
MVAVSAFAFAAPAPKTPAKIDSPVIGKWRLVSLDGRPPGERNPETETFRPDGTVVRDGAGYRALGRGPSELPYTVDGTADPPRLDMGWRPVLGIFRVKGDTLTVCYAVDSDTIRPTWFGEKGTLLCVYERIKPTD